jgi:hypothetical protein
MVVQAHRPTIFSVTVDRPNLTKNREFGLFSALFLFLFLFGFDSPSLHFCFIQRNDDEACGVLPCLNPFPAQFNCLIVSNYFCLESQNSYSFVMVS